MVEQFTPAVEGEGGGEREEWMGEGATTHTTGGMDEAVVERAFTSKPSRLVISGETPCVEPVAAAAT